MGGKRLGARRLRGFVVDVEKERNAMTETNNKVRRGRILIALAALVVVVAAFFIFVTMNNERVSAQNAQYLEGSTQQSARRISEWMTDSQTEVRLLTSLYESSLASAEEASIDGIRDLAAYTKFSYVTFSDASGMTYDDRGRSEDASERDYFVRGMEGESGVYATDNSLFYDDLSVIFYTPLRYNDEVIGVVSGAYREEIGRAHV